MSHSTHADSDSREHSDSEKGQGRRLETRFASLWSETKSRLDWIPTNCTFSRLKPVIRSAVAAWVALVFFLIPPVNAVLGQAGFLVLLTAFISPPNEPVTAVVEKEIIIVFAVLLSWAWSCFAIKVANLARTSYVTQATRTQIFSGQYIEPLPSVILAIFLFLGAAFILFVRAWLGPGPFVPATVLACICVDISLTIAPLYPYPNYLIGSTVVIPIAFHAGLSILASLLIFPETVNAQFVKRFKAVLDPLAAGVKQQHTILSTQPLSDDFTPNTFAAEIEKSEAALAPLEASARLVNRDVSWGRLSGNNLHSLQMFGRKLMMRAAGMAYFYRTLDNQRQKFPETPLQSQPPTPVETPVQSRVVTPTASDDEDDPSHIEKTGVHGDRSSWHGSSSSHNTKRQLQHHHHHHHRHSLLSHLSHSHLLREALNHSQEHHPVGIFESQLYMNIEKRRRHPQGSAIEENSLKLLAESVEDLLTKVGEAMDHVLDWLERMNSERFAFWRKHSVSWKDSIASNELMMKTLNAAMERFSASDRHIILEPYRGILDPLKHSSDLPPHRYLFRSYLYQYHLMRFSECLYELIKEIDNLDKTRQHSRLWPPLLPLHHVFRWSASETNESTEKADDEDPDAIPGISIKSNCEALGEAEPRDADALPPSNVIELVGTRIYAHLSALGHGNVLFAIKAGILSVLLSLPSFVRESAAFAYRNKSIWAVFIAQLTLARHRGDTIFGFLSRLVCTFIGGLVGLIFWYSSSGNGPGNAYGVAIVGAVILPILIFARLNAPGPPMTTIILATTVVLIVGYSWQNGHFPIPTGQGNGWDVAWRRFLLVAIGVTAASILSYLPPSTTIRRYHRTALSTTTSEIGYLYCAIVSYAHHHCEEDGKEIIKNTIALRAKLKRMSVQTTNVPYEFSLRGKWPTKRYKAILRLQLEISYLLSHLMSVIDHLEPAWSRAFLQRTRFLDPDFLGSVLAVISLISTALRTAAPLPQITPAPLLDRYQKHHQGLDVLQQEAADDCGLPRTVTFETLQNEQYRCFSVGIASATGIITRLDLLMHATKELVGERFHIEGVFLPFVHSEEAQSEGHQGKVTRFAATTA